MSTNADLNQDLNQLNKDLFDCKKLKKKQCIKEINCRYDSKQKNVYQKK